MCATYLCRKVVTMKYYEGKAPCPGCGKTGEEKPRGSKDGLCYDCTHQLAIGRAISEERDLPRNYYRLEELCIGEMTWYTIRVPELEHAVIDLLQTFSQFDEKYAMYCHNHVLAGRIDAAICRHRIVLPERTFEAAKKLCEVLREAASQLIKERDSFMAELYTKLAEQKSAIFNEGVKKGRNLLAQLNAGEITLDELYKEQEYRDENI